MLQQRRTETCSRGLRNREASDARMHSKRHDMQSTCQKVGEVFLLCFTMHDAVAQSCAGYSAVQLQGLRLNPRLNTKPAEAHTLRGLRSEDALQELAEEYCPATFASPLQQAGAHSRT